MSKIILSNVKIERARWGKDEGKYTGVISFTSENADISFQLNDDHVQKIFAIAMNRLTEVAHEVSEELMFDIIESMPKVD